MIYHPSEQMRSPGTPVTYHPGEQMRSPGDPVTSVEMRLR